MKKALYLTLMATAAIVSFNTTPSNAYASTNEHVVQGSLTSPDGKNLFPGGEVVSSVTNNRQYKTIAHDNFLSWNTSIFNPGLGSPLMGNGWLILPNYATVTTNIPLQKGNTYRITLGGLTNEVGVNITIPREGIAYQDFFSGYGNDVSFLYTHTENSNIILELVGTGSPTLRHFTVEQQ